jgi:uncharacterized protein
VSTVIWHGIRDAFLMFWEVWWALVFGFAISAVVQAWVPRERIQRTLGGRDARSVMTATGLGAASSSCSYAAVAIARSLFEKGASAASSLAFQIASTNLVWELGLVLWVLIGWQFALAEYLGGIVMIVLLAIGLRAFVARELEEKARARSANAPAGHHHHHGPASGSGSGAGPGPAWRPSIARLTDVAHYFISDWQTLWKEILAGFVLAGFAAQLSNHFFSGLFVEHAAKPIPAIENALVGPLIAVLSFVCSVGNVPLAAVLWSAGISFAGVLSFLFADLIVLPIILIYRKYYGISYALRITLLMFAAMVLAALLVSWVFGLLGLIPSGPRPTRHDIFGAVRVNYELVLNVWAFLLFATFAWLRVRPVGAAYSAG